MTVYRLPYPCWTAEPSLWGDGDAHYDDRKRALTAIREAWDYDQDWAFPSRIGAWWRELRFLAHRLRPGAPRPRQLAAPCWLVRCDECEEHIDEQDEGYIAHCDSRQDAEDTMAAFEWVCAGDLVYCPGCAPEDGVVPPPPSPAEQEAAGQLSLLAQPETT